MRIRKVLLLAVIFLMLGDFVFRGIIPSLDSGKNDFTDPFVGAWLWRHGFNPYDLAQATATGMALTGSSMRIFPIYPPTTYLLLAPLTFLSWGWANFVLAILETLSVYLVAWCVVGISGRTFRDDEAWTITALVFTFASFHTSVHVANVAVISTALCLTCVYLAKQNSDFSAGILLGVATCLKPHLCIWLFGFYALRRNWRLLVVGSLTGGIALTISMVKAGLSPKALLANYSTNLNELFRPGGGNDFSLANSLRFELANFQVVLGPVLGRSGANTTAFFLAALGLSIWIYAILRNRQCSTSLALTSLVALSFLPVYHRVYDTGILTLVLAWLFELEQRQRTVKRLAMVLFLILLLPIESIGVRLQAILSAQDLHSWWWNFLIAPYTAWTLLAFSAVLLYALYTFPSFKKSRDSVKPV
jgi:hypothetical protein